MVKSNPTCWEWLSSDIIYLDNPIRKKLKEEFIMGFSKFALKKHYLSMARQNFNKYINQIGDTANLKKYVYVLRSIACVNYIEKMMIPPPKDYKKIIKYLPKYSGDFMNKIVIDKKKSESLEGKRDYAIENFVVSYFDKLFKIKEFDNRRYDIANILYRIEKNEV